MPSEVKFGKFWAGYLAVSVILGLLILFFSLSLAGLVRTFGLNSDTDKLNYAIWFNDIGENGEEIQKQYKLPPAGILPNNKLYALKYMRNQLWQLITTGDYNRANLSFILANKKLAEAKELLNKNDEKSKMLAFKCGQEAFEALKYADEVIDQQGSLDHRWQKLQEDIYLAGKVYKSYCQNEKKDYQTIEDWLKQQDTEE